MDFRLTYDKLDKRVRKRSSVNLEYVTFVRNRENNYVYLLIVLVVADLIHYVIGRTISNYIGFIVMLVIIYLGIFFIYARVGGFGISIDTFLYVKYSNFLYKEKSVEEVDVNNVRYLDVKNHLFSTSVELRYVDETGKAREINFSIPKYIIDKNRKRFKDNRNSICERLIGLQKILDKGDF